MPSDEENQRNSPMRAVPPERVPQGKHDRRSAGLEQEGPSSFGVAPKGGLWGGRRRCWHPLFSIPRAGLSAPASVTSYLDNDERSFLSDRLPPNRSILSDPL